MKSALLNVPRWPLSIKAPAVVAIFMLVVSVIMTNAVLGRLRETQERHLASMSSVYLNGLASALIPYVLRADVWEIFEIIERGAALEGEFGRASVVVVDAKGTTLAASDPRAAPVLSRQDDLDRRFTDNAVLVVDAPSARAFARRSLVYQNRRIGTVYADFDIRHLLREREEVLRALVLTNAIIALLLATLGYWVVRRMLRPLSLLSHHLEAGVSGAVEPIPDSELRLTTSEHARVFRRFNALAAAVSEREAMARELAREEHLASLGRLASGMAHEINNPLGGLFNAIDTLKAHGDKPAVRRSSVDLIDRGLRGIRDVVRSTLATYRADRDPRPMTADDYSDLRLLVRSEANRRAIALDWTIEVAGNGQPAATTIRQIALNLLLNALNATPEGGRVAFNAIGASGSLELEIHDQGSGLTRDAEAVLLDAASAPTPLRDGTGLGLWMTCRLTREAGGAIDVGVSPLGGTLIRLRFPGEPAAERRHVA